MKKTIILSVCLFALLFQAQAQSQFGVKVGGSLSSFRETGSYDGEDFAFKANLLAGVYTQIAIGESIILQPELVYDRRGTIIKNSITSSSKKSRFNFAYLSLPIMIGYKVTDKVQFLVGPQANYLLTARAKGDGFDNDVKDIVGYNHYDYGVAGGVKYAINSKINAELRYYRGLSILFERELFDSAWKMQSLQLHFSYALFGK
jgi:hypothetical protein